jgi:excisionase family DNA binding protein
VKKIFNQKFCSSKVEVNPVSLNKSSLKTESDEWLTSFEVCTYLKISKKTLMNKVSLGHIPRFKFGRLNRYLKVKLKDLSCLLSEEEKADGNKTRC